jgi:hypothetical protein
VRLPQTGGCLCGALRYEMARPPNATYTCHCTECQRLTGSAFSTGLVVAAEALRTTGIEPRPFRRVADSGRTVTGWLCPECGVRVCGGPKPGSAPPPGALAIVRAGTLDDTSWLRPTLHFWTRSAQPWVVLPPGGEVFETQPADFGWMRPPSGR